MLSDWPWALLLILISPAVGSFLGLVVDRLIRQVPVLWQVSHCSTCDARLIWRDLVPILSALHLRGRCRVCGAEFPGFLLRIEIAALLAALLAVATVPGAVELWLTAAMLWCLIALFYCDLVAFRLPDVLTLALFLFALAYASLTRSILDGLMGAAIGMAAFWLIRLGYQYLRGREGLGLGDVKLMAGIGAAVGALEIPVVTLIAAVLAIGVTVFQASSRKALPESGEKLPFGSYLCGAAAVVILAWT